MSTAAPDLDLFLLRLSGEVTTKARGTRLAFTRRLARNVGDALATAGTRTRVERGWTRLFVEAPPAIGRTVLPRISGVQSVSPVQRTAYGSLDELVQHGEALFVDTVAGRTFAVRARRGGDRSRIPFTSPQVERLLGARLLPGAAGVDLGAPEITIQVEVREQEAFFFTERLPGPGGLPLGVEGRALALISGGFDSAVAAWQLIRRGVELDYVFFNLGGALHREGALRVTAVLADQWSAGSRPRFHEVDLRPAVRAMEGCAEPRYWQILLKRLMFRAADAVAQELRAEALVTGEAIGQVSSQTLRNLRVIEEICLLPVLRPLVGANKDEIVAAARRIGTYELSAAVAEYCALDAPHPATRASLSAVAAEESKLDLEALAAAVRERQILDLRAHRASPAQRDLEVEAPPPGAVVLDLRSPASYRSWHLPGALLLDYFSALATWPGFDREQVYVLYCEVGLKSAHLAEEMRAGGFRAFHFRNGLKGVLSHAGARHGLPAEEIESAVVATRTTAGTDRSPR